MNYTILFISLFLIVGCDNQQQPRQYTEVTPAPAPLQQTASPAADASAYSWNLPKGWAQGPDKDMRLASFYRQDAPDAVDCSMVALPGMAGGLEANLKRWMGQVNIDSSEANYQKLADGAQAVETAGGLKATVYDLGALQQGPQPESMIAAIITNNDVTLFVKMTGSTQNIQDNRAAFLDILKSITPNANAQSSQ